MISDNLARLMRPPSDDATRLERLQVRSVSDPTLDTLRSGVFAEEPSDLPIELASMEDAVVTPRGFVNHAGSLIWDATYINHAWASGHGSSAIPDVFNANGLWSYDPVQGSIGFASQNAETIDEPCFLFNSENAMGNFAHFVHDLLLQVPTYLEARRSRPMVPLLVGTGIRMPAARRLLERVLGCRSDGWLLTRGAFVRVRRLFVPTRHVDFAQQRVSAPAARRMRATVAQALRRVPASTPRHVFVSRSDAAGLRLEATIANADALRLLLRDLGIQEVLASELEPQLYFETFKNAGTVLGLHGAGLMNVVLSSSGRLIELATPRVGGTGLVMVAGAAGYPTARLVHHESHIGTAAQVSTVEIDLDALRSAFETLA